MPDVVGKSDLIIGNGIYELYFLLRFLGKLLNESFSLLRPLIEFTAEQIMQRTNNVFVFQVRKCTNRPIKRDMVFWYFSGKSALLQDSQGQGDQVVGSDIGKIYSNEL